MVGLVLLRCNFASAESVKHRRMNSCVIQNPIPALSNKGSFLGTLQEQLGELQTSELSLLKSERHF